MSEFNQRRSTRYKDTRWNLINDANLKKMQLGKFKVQCRKAKKN